ncbi:MAG: PH domain-containing protein [Deltaproteobacteria bacterium]|nr:PH domain-containing protein [Deltaproteobacteria bacterium]
MLLDPLRRALLAFLRVSQEPPEAPGGEHVEVFRASPRYLSYLLLAWALQSAFMILVMGGAVTGACIAIVVEEGVLWPALLLGGATALFLFLFTFVSYATIRLDYEMRWYVLTDRSLRIREGIAHMREVTLTLANVQDLKVSQGPLQRLLDLTDVVVDTAGGGGAAAAGTRGSVHGHAGVVRGIERGSELVAKIKARVQQRKGTGLGDGDEQEAPAAAADPLVEVLREVRDEARALRMALG